MFKKCDFPIHIKFSINLLILSIYQILFLTTAAGQNIEKKFYNCKLGVCSWIPLTLIKYLSETGLKDFIVIWSHTMAKLFLETFPRRLCFSKQLLLIVYNVYKYVVKTTVVDTTQHIVITPLLLLLRKGL